MMSKICSSRFPKLLLLLAGLQLFALTGCVSDQGTDLNLGSKFSGEEMFQGIFFAYGDFAAAIPSLSKFVEASKDYSPEDRREVEKMIGTLKNLIKEQDATFFDRFKQRVDSRNHQEISSAIKDGAIAIYHNIDAVFPGMSEVIKQMERDGTTKSGEFDATRIEANMDKYTQLLSNNVLGSGLEKAPCTWAAACVFYFALAAHNTVAVTANVVAAGALFVYLGVKFWGPGIETNANGELEHEIMVDQIAKMP